VKQHVSSLYSDEISPLHVISLVKHKVGARGVAVSWGTALQAGRSRVRFGIFH